MPVSRRALRGLVVSIGVLAFMAGAFAGVAADRLLAPRLRIRAPMEEMANVLDRLELTAEQRARAQAILTRTAPQSQEIMLELAERLQLVADSVDAELRAILTPAQRLRLDSLRTEPRVLLKRKAVTPLGPKVDTLIDTTGRVRPP
jgi:hypothetical protein